MRLIFEHLHTLKKKSELEQHSRRTDGLLARDNHSNNPGLTSTYKGCPRMNNLNEKCDVCDNYDTTHQSNGFEVDLKCEYNSWIKKKSTSEYLVPIAGNLEDFGWAVYDGINV